MPELVDLEVREVSLVDRPANRRLFRVFKREGEEEGVKKRWFCLFKKASLPEKEGCSAEEEIVPTEKRTEDPFLKSVERSKDTQLDNSADRGESNEERVNPSFPDEVEGVMKEWAEIARYLQEGQEKINKRMEKLEKQMAQKQSQEEPKKPASLWTGILGLE